MNKGMLPRAQCCTRGLPGGWASTPETLHATQWLLLPGDPGCWLGSRLHTSESGRSTFWGVFCKWKLSLPDSILFIIPASDKWGKVYYKEIAMKSYMLWPSIFQLPNKRRVVLCPWNTGSRWLPAMKAMTRTMEASPLPSGGLWVPRERCMLVLGIEGPPSTHDKFGYVVSPCHRELHFMGLEK